MWTAKTHKKNKTLIYISPTSNLIYNPKRVIHNNRILSTQHRTTSGLEGVNTALGRSLRFHVDEKISGNGVELGVFEIL